VLRDCRRFSATENSASERNERAVHEFLSRSAIVTDITVSASPLQPPMPDPQRYILATFHFTNGGERSFNAAVLTNAGESFFA
jgi:hypothetical protein